MDNVFCELRIEKYKTKKAGDKNHSYPLLFYFTPYPLS